MPYTVEEWIERVGLGGYAFHYPSELSGGMQKRCSIARTLVYDPDVVLMDEPFGPLDAMTRMKLQQELLDLWEENRKTFIFVTHDLGEAIALSDEVVVMTGRPGQVKGVVQVPIPRPREIGALSEDEGYGRLSRELWQFFKAEIAFVENSSIVVS